MAVEGEPSSNYAYHMLKALCENPTKTLLVVDGEAVTGRELHQRISAAVHLLLTNGVVPGNRILLTIKPSIDFYALAIASFVVGGCIVVLDTSMGLERSNHCIATAKPDVWAWPKRSWYKHLKYLLPSLRAIPIKLEMSSLASSSVGSAQFGVKSGVKSGVKGVGGGVVELVEPEACVPVEHAIVTFTTGSTGMPKLMLRKHSFVLNQSRSLSLSYEKVVRREIGLAEGENTICTNLPLFPLHYILIGACCILYPSITKCDPAQVLSTMKKYSATVLGGSPAFAHKIATYVIKENTTLPIKLTLVGGAPVYRGMFRTLTSVTPDKKAFVLYGSTEVEPISAISAEEKLRVEAEKPDGMCVGRPAFDGSAKVIQILKEPLSEPVDMADLELPRGQIGEIAVTGWHVNTYQVDPKRVLTDMEGEKWLRIEDAGYMDGEGRLWLVGRVKWRVERDGKTHWSTVVEQKVLDRCSMLTFATYLPHKEKAWLFLEAPRGLPENEETALKQFLVHEGIPVDHLVIKSHIPKDRRHLSKPNTAVLFSSSRLNRYTKVVSYLLRSNPLLVLVLVAMQLMLILAVIVLIVFL